MGSVYTHADSLRCYLTGASSDGGIQANANLCLGNFRSSTEALSLGIQIINPISNVSVLYAGGANPVGSGTLTAVDANNLTWQPNGASGPGLPATFSGSGVLGIVEALNSPGAYLRLSVTTPLIPGQSTINLNYLTDNVFGFDDVSIAGAAAGISEYRATIVRNESVSPVTGFQRYLATLGTPQISNNGGLGSGGSGVISTTGTFADWPVSGWCQVQSSGGTLKEVVYYTSRTNTILTIPSSGRGLLGTSATAGSTTDNVYPVPGIALAIDPTGVVAFGSSIQTIANALTAPTGVTWNLGLTPGTGLQIGSIPVGQQVGIWMWRQIPAGATANPAQVTKILDSFSAF